MASALPLLLLGLFALCLVPAAFAQVPTTPPGTCGFCLRDTDCDRGVCDNVTSSCLCDKKYACSGNNGSETCSYKRKSRVKAFLLSFFLGGFGADRFYLLYGGIGALKLVLGLISCCMCIPMFLLAKSGAAIPLRILQGLLGLALFGWWLADVIMIGTGKLKDRRGYKTYDNM